MLIDSDVLVWFVRGHPAAARRLQSITGWRLADALIGATAIEHREALLTGNLKHSRPLMDC